MTDEAVQVGVRRVPGLDLAAPLPDSDPALLERIRAEIRERGPMPFARFMALALYDPDAGYYARGDDRGPGRSGDFLTAPEGHAIFGWAIARQLEEVWDRLGRPAPFVVREHGAGSGGLALGILDGLRRSGSPLFEAIRYEVVEVGEGKVAAIRERLDAAGLADRLETATDGPAPGAVLANELLDALPVHRVEGGPSDADGVRLLERFVDLDGDALGTSLGPPSTPALAARLASEGVALAPGQAAEICLGIDDWVRTATRPLERGLLLVIDYGAEARDLYAPSRGSTLRAYHRHRVHDDPLVAIGRQDLTAHVDLTALDRAATAEGLEPLGRATQAAFLASLGIGELLVGLQAEPGTTLESYLAARSAVARMLDPRATGGFAVRAHGRGLPARPALRGFAGGAAPLGASPDPNR
ncbi:MAG TPA: SAM-dependent methyltransferase [Candidatus Limnocylindrales bacterium]